MDEEEASLFRSASRSAEVSSLAVDIYLCILCNKPFANEPSRDRHVRYCGRRRRHRPRSCRACNVAKSKCTFESPCLRCRTKGLECVYNGPLAVRERAEFRSSSKPQSPEDPSLEQTDDPSIYEVLRMDDQVYSSTDVDFVSGDDLMTDNSHLQFPFSEFPPTNDLHGKALSIENLFARERHLNLEDEVHVQDRCLSTISSGSWCAWMQQRDMSLLVVAKNSIRLDTSFMAMYQMERPHAQTNADVIIQSLRSLPTMMLRRRTFPWYIHANPPSTSGADESTLPTALAACMSIAQMFASRTAETRPFIWRTIKAECDRFESEMQRTSKFGLLAVIQASMIYMIMYIIDGSPTDNEIGSVLLHTTQKLYGSFKRCGQDLVDRHVLQSRECDWSDWIFAESERRLANLWFLIGCVVHVKNGKYYDPVQSYRSIALPSSKALWEAATYSEWSSEYEAGQSLQSSELLTLGDLLDAQKSQYTPSSARKLDKWNSRTDVLGSLLNLVGTMV